MRFTPKESETPSAFKVAERNVCALIRSENSSDGPDGQVVQPNFVVAPTLGSKKLGLSAVSNDGAGNFMFEALGQAFAKASNTWTDARTATTAVVAKMMVLEKIQACFLWDRWCGRDVHVETVLAPA